MNRLFFQPGRRLRRTDKLSALSLALAPDFLCLRHSSGQGADAADGHGTCGCEFPAGLGHLPLHRVSVRFGAHRHRRTQIVAACMAVLGACGLAVWTKNGFPERFPALPGIDIRKIGEAKLDADFKPTKGMEVLDLGWNLVAHMGYGERKVALSGDSQLFHYGPRVQQLADEGQLVANTYFVTGPGCAPVPGVIQRDKFARCIKLPGILVDLVQREKVQSVVLGAAWTGYSDEGMLIEREGKRLPLNTKEGMDDFYANLEDYVRLLQGQGAKVYLVLGVPIHHRFNPGEMVTRSLTGFQIAPDVEKAIPIAELQAVHATVNAKLRAVGEHTGATLLDPFPTSAAVATAARHSSEQAIRNSRTTCIYAQSSCGKICGSSILC